MSRKGRMKAKGENIEKEPDCPAEEKAAEVSESPQKESPSPVVKDVSEQIVSRTEEGSGIIKDPPGFMKEYDAPLEGNSLASEKKRYVRYSPLTLILLGICVFVFSFSMLGVFEQFVVDVAGSSEISELMQSVFGVEGGKGGLSEDGSELYPSSSVDGEWQAISPSSIDVESLPFLQSVGFDVLGEQNPDTVAWMYWPTTVDVKGLPFNLPVVQAKDNDYYLSKSFDRSYSVNGWIYGDYRCDFSDIASNSNIILYGHARSYLIFGGLRYLNTKTKWQQDARNHFIYINTPTERTVWQVFSWYETTTAFNYIDTHFSSDKEYVSFLNTLQDKNTVSAFQRFEFTEKNQILTLSTCKGSNSDVRIAVHAVLVKHEKDGDLQIVVALPEKGSASGDNLNGGNASSGASTVPDVTDSTNVPETTDPVTEPSTDLSSSVDSGTLPSVDPTDVSDTTDVTDASDTTEATDVTDVSDVTDPSDSGSSAEGGGGSSDPEGGSDSSSSTDEEDPLNTDIPSDGDASTDGSFGTSDPPVDSSSGTDGSSSVPTGGSVDSGTPPDDEEGQ